MKYFIFILAIIIHQYPFFSFADSNRGIKKKEHNISSSENRFALVIGNSKYNFAPLKNPVNDARSISSTLEELGFHVTLLEDARQEKMKRAIDKFGRIILDGGVGLFYFSGHGMQVDGTNYLIPIDAVIDDEADVEYEAVMLDTEELKEQFTSEHPKVTGFPHVIIDGEVIGGLVETARLFLQKGMVSSRKK